MVALFTDLGTHHPLSETYRRRLGYHPLLKRAVQYAVRSM